MTKGYALPRPRTGRQPSLGVDRSEVERREALADGGAPVGELAHRAAEEDAELAAHRLGGVTFSDRRGGSSGRAPSRVRGRGLALNRREAQTAEDRVFNGPRPQPLEAFPHRIAWFQYRVSSPNA